MILYFDSIPPNNLYLLCTMAALKYYCNYQTILPLCDDMYLSSLIVYYHLEGNGLSFIYF